MIRARLAPALLVAALAGCATSPVQLSRAQLRTARTAPPAPAAAPARPPGLPRVRVAPVEDQRSDRTSMGALAGRQVSSEELGQWLDGELASLSSPAFEVAGRADEGPVRLAVQPRILKAYVSGLAVTKTAVLVLEVELSAAGGEPARKVIRGQHASMNWASTQGEIAGALREATRACLDQLRAEVEARLRSG